MIWRHATSVYIPYQHISHNGQQCSFKRFTDIKPTFANINALPNGDTDWRCGHQAKLGKCSSRWKAGQKITLLRSNHSGYGVGKWEKALHRNACYHWLSPYPEWSLHAKGVWLYIVFHLELYSLSGKTSYCQISLSFGLPLYPNYASVYNEWTALYNVYYTLQSKTVFFLVVSIITNW